MLLLANHVYDLIMHFANVLIFMSFYSLVLRYFVSILNNSPFSDEVHIFRKRSFRRMCKLTIIKKSKQVYVIYKNDITFIVEKSIQIIILLTESRQSKLLNACNCHLYFVKRV